MVSSTIKAAIPQPLKHPLRAISKTFWDIRGLPSQSLGDVSIIKTLLSSLGGETLRVFEWGSGASTIYYTKYLRAIGRKFQWHAAENSPLWRQRGHEKVLRAGMGDQVHIHDCEFPAFWEIPGYSGTNPAPPRSFTDNHEGVQRYVDLPTQLGQQFDLMIVDGRYRRRCLLAAGEALAPGGVVLLHDAQKTHYHPSLSAYPHVRFMTTGRMPGLGQQSTIALCSMDEASIIETL